MPHYKTHLVGGLLIFLCSLPIFYLFILPCSFPLIIELLFCTLLGSLFPDIDTKSKAQLLCYRVIFLCMLYLLFKKLFVIAGVLSLLAMIPLIVHHRGIFHQLYFLSACVLCIIGFFYIFIPSMWMRIALDLGFFLIGIISHLVLDLGIRRTFGF